MRCILAARRRAGSPRNRLPGSYVNSVNPEKAAAQLLNRGDVSAVVVEGCFSMVDEVDALVGHC